MAPFSRSDDRRRSRLQRSDLPFKLGANEDGRGNGERLAVDPGDGRILYLGTPHDGLWRSIDRGATWSRVAAFPDITEAVPPNPDPIPGETSEQHWRRIACTRRRHYLRQIQSRRDAASPTIGFSDDLCRRFSHEPAESLCYT